MKLKKLILENFKGVRQAEYDFADKTKIKGMNGAGKTTLSDAWLWLLTDKATSLASNPAVRPTDAIDEQIVSVTAGVMFGEKFVELQKSQKLKRSKAGTVALTNSYMINSVPKSEKDFKAYLTDLGVDFDKFLPCSHPSVMLAGINNKKERTALRNMLFEMASEITDAEVAKDDPELEEIRQLLENYKADEIEAMQNATLRKIRENYGKEGEILRAKIEGMEKAKEMIDIAFHKDKADKLSAEIDKVKGQIEFRQKELEKAKDAQTKVMELSFHLNDIENRANAERSKTKQDAEAELFKLETQKASLGNSIRSSERQCAAVRKNLEDAQNSISNLTAKRQKYIDYVFDASTAVCPTCGQTLPQGKVALLKEKNERKAQEVAQRCAETIKSGERIIQSCEDEIAENKQLVSKATAEIAKLNTKIEKAKRIVADAESIPKADMKTNVEYQQVRSEMDELKDVAGAEMTLRAEIRDLEFKIESIKEERDAHIFEISKEKQNQRIDAKIAQLREDQKNYEQSKADAEMILDQLKTLNMKKNELLQESVNSHFNLVDFVLFTTLKNGETKDACIPTINGKRFGESMNNALEVLAKIDVMDSIQRFYGLDYPIILDNAECLDSESMNQIKTDHQLIMLCVSDDEDLVFEKEGEE